jgi:3-hydroxyacyl-[acyl-carrier-protein] dehydratase
MRYLMVDRIVELEKGHSAVGLKNVCQSEDVFAYHFPDLPVMPGALTLEAMAQTAGRLICASRDFAVRPMLLAVERARFRRTIVPGDQMRIRVTVQGMSTQAAELSAVVEVDGALAADAVLKFVLVKADEPASWQMRRQFESLAAGVRSATGA